MIALVVGLGSIGRRHAEVLSEIGKVEIYTLRSLGNKDDREDFCRRLKIKEFQNLHDAIDARPNFAVIANPTSLHVKTAFILCEAGIPFLIEKPVSDRRDGINKLLLEVRKKSIPSMVGFQMRYHPGYQILINLIDRGLIGKPLHVQGYVGQYLPNWRSEIDYRQSCSAKKELGGGVILDLCHEIDIVVSILGKVDYVTCINGQVSNLEIDTEDVGDIIFKHQDGGVSMIHLNYLERAYTWETRITGEKGSLLWDYGHGFVELYKSNGIIKRFDNPQNYTRNSLFKDQISCWLSVLEGKAAPKVSLEDGAYITEIALAARTSAEEKRYIKL